MHPEDLQQVKPQRKRQDLLMRTFVLTLWYSPSLEEVAVNERGPQSRETEPSTWPGTHIYRSLGLHPTTATPNTQNRARQNNSIMTNVPGLEDLFPGAKETPAPATGRLRTAASCIASAHFKRRRWFLRA